MEADFVVVGAGVAGTVVASALAAPGRTVVLIEEGERREHPYARVPASALVAPTRRVSSRNVTSEPDPTSAGRALRWRAPRGLCAGRTLDGLVYERGFAAEFDEWATLGARGWSYADVEPVFARLEAGDGAGRPGIAQTTAADSHPLTAAFLEACARNTKAARPDTACMRSAQAARLMLRDGRRETPADLWLRPRLRDREIQLLTRTRVRALQLDGLRCIGVLARRDGQEIQIRARAEVLLAAGVFGSPKLLMVSGIGPPGLLESAGISLRHALPGVGGNLSDHAAVSVAARTRVKGIARGDRAAAGALLGYLRWRASRLGPFALPSVLATGWAASAGASDADIGITLTPAALLHGLGDEALSAEHGLTITVHGRRPRSRGRLRLSGGGLDDPLKIEHLLLSDPDEMRILCAGTRLARQLCATAPLEALVAGELEPGDSRQSDADLADLIRRCARPLGHAGGTCRMGAAGDPDAVVDPRLKVHGIRGLRVLDASVMPRMPGGSPGAAAIMVAARAAEFIREER